MRGGHAFRVAVPQGLTACRLIFGVAAFAAALDGRLFRAATLITLGGVLDGLDGIAARWLDAGSRFGVLFDYVADYICFVIAPWALARALLGGDLSLLQEALVGLPLLTGAMRYAQNGRLLLASSDADLPGLGTVFFAFICVAAAFVDAPAFIGPPRFGMVLLGFVVAFSLLMRAPVRYPKITKFRGMSPVVLILLAAMPFVGTKVLAGAMFVLGLLYAAVAPFFVDRESAHASAHQIR